MKRLFILFTFIFSLSTFNSSAQGSGYALDFDGSSDYVKCPTNGYNSGNSFSVELWLMPTSFDSKVLVWEGDNVNNPSLNGSSTSLTFYVSNSGLADIGTGTMVIGQWYHVAAVYDKINQIQSLYVNGILKGHILGLDEAPSFGNNFYLCDRQNGGFANNNRDYPGIIDEVRVWNKALTQSEVQTNMCQKLIGTEPGLVAYYSMDEGVNNSCSGGEDVCDLTGNGNHGTKY